MDTDFRYWCPEFELPSNAGDRRFDFPVWQFIIFLNNLWCSFCPPLCIFYAEEIEPILLILTKAVLKQLTTKLLIFDFK